MVCENFINPFDFNCVFINTLAGSVNIFAYLAILVISIIAARFRMTGVLLSSMLLIFGLAIIGIASWIFWLSFVLLLLYFGYMFTRFKRGG
jgi:hypothetical protein